MKKLKLQALELGATEILTREQMKMVGAGSGSGYCLTGTCTLYDSNSGVTYSGSCQSASLNLGPGIYSTQCFCYTSISQMGPVPLSSNGGVSRCTA
jgi:hypothetical protein